MIRAVFYKNSDDRIMGFSIKGHSDYDISGRDIICASVSVLTINTINAIERFTDCVFKCEQGESGLIRFKTLSVEDSGEQLLLRTLVLGIEGICEEYGGKYVSVHYKEV